MQEVVRFDAETSAVLARRVKAQFQRCWRNAAMAVSHLGVGAYYVEGWVVTNGRDPYVIEHGWCEAHGRIIDPSYTPAVTPCDPPVAYFPGVRFEASMAGTGLRGHRLPMAWSRESTASYEEAFTAAWLDAATRRAARHPYLARLPRTRVVDCRRDPFDLFIGRPSKWAIPLSLTRHQSPAELAAQFRRWLIQQPDLLQDVWSLRGKILGCDCAQAHCHGNILARLADLGAAAGVAVRQVG